MRRYIVSLLALLSLTGAGCSLKKQATPGGVSFFEKKKACANYIDKVQKEIDEINSESQKWSTESDTETVRVESLKRVCYVESIDSCVSVIETNFFFRKKSGILATNIDYKNVLTNDFIGTSMSPSSNEKTTNPESYSANYSNYVKQNEELGGRYKCVD